MTLLMKKLSCGLLMLPKDFELKNDKLINLVSETEELVLRNEGLQSTITQLENQNEKTLEEQIKRISMEWKNIFSNFDEEVDLNGTEYHRTLKPVPIGPEILGLGKITFQS